MIGKTEVIEVLERIVEKWGADYCYPMFAIRREDFDTTQEWDEFLDGPAQICHYRWTLADQRAAHAAGQDIVVGQPACLVGHVLAEFNLLDDAVPDPEGEMNTETARVLMQRWFTDPATDALQIAQAVQDNGESWGHALAEARKGR